MTTASFPIPEVYSAGRKPLLYGANGGVPDGSWQSGVLAFSQMIYGRRGKVLFSCWAGNTTYFTAGVTSLRGRFVSPQIGNGGHVTVYAAILAARTNSATSHATTQWTIDAVTQDALYLGGNTTAATSMGDYQLVTQRLVDGTGANICTTAAVHTCSLAIAANARVYGAVIFSLPISVDDGAGALGGRLQRINESAVGAPITTSSLLKPIGDAAQCWYYNGPAHIRWVDATGAGITRVGATYANVTDASTTGYAAAASGFWTIPYKHARYGATTVPVTLWCYASATTANGKVRFVNSAGTIATISVTGGAGYYTTTGTIDPSLSSDLVIIEHANTSGGADSVTTYSAGMYESA